jgi:hypothetical protein
MNCYRGRCCLGVAVLLASVWVAPARAQVEPEEPVGSNQDVEAISPTDAEVVETPSEDRQHFSLSLGGGGAYLAVGDYKDVFDNLNSSRTDDEKYEVPSLGGEATFDAIFHVTRNFGVGLGAGYVRASKASDVGGSASSDSSTLTFSAFRVRLGAYGFLPLGKVLEAYGNISPTLYVASLKDEGQWSYYDASMSFSGDWSDEGSRKQLGVEGAVGLKIKIGPAFAFFLELGGRYAKLSPFEGSYSWTDNDGDSGSADDATLYYWESSYRNGPWRKNIAMNHEPRDSGDYSYRNVREGNVDFSGGVARIGVSIGF